jgi:hypothetical protein
MSTTKRMVHTGVELVRDSEDESGDSLEDLDDIIAAVRPKRTQKQKDAEGKAIIIDLETPKFKLKMADKGPAKSKFKTSLADLIKMDQETKEAEARVAQMEQKLKADGLSDLGSVSGRAAITQEILAATLEDGTENTAGKAQKMMAAIERTEALHFQTAFYMFDEPNPAEADEKVKFPKKYLPISGWGKMLRVPDSRDSTFRSGLLLTVVNQLPDELLLWILDEMIIEKREDMLQAYSDLLVLASSSAFEILPKHTISLFSRLGARSYTLEPDMQLRTEHQVLGACQTTIHPNLIWIIRLIERVSPHLSIPPLEQAAIILMRISISSNILDSGDLLMAISRTIATIFDHLAPDNRTVGASMFKTISSPILRHRLVSNLPAYTQATHLFRRRLALAFALDSPRFLTAEMSNTALSAHVLLHLSQSNLYRITQDTDYTHITATFKMLDLGIDCGFSSFRWLDSTADRTPRPSSTASKFANPHSAHAAKKKGAPSADEAIPDTEALFNEAVDDMVAGLNAIQARIVTSGASHMSRFEAKVAAERVSQRLLYGVRSRIKAGTDWYAKAEGAKKQEVFMNGWIEKDRASKANATAGAEDDGDAVDDVDMGTWGHT